jgi:hypothetical protein
VLAVIGLVMSALDRVVDRVLLAAAVMVEVAALVQSVVAGVELAGSHQVASAAAFVGYLIGAVLVMPVAVVWAWAERNRWTGAVVALGGLTVAVMTLRLTTLWNAGG